MAYKWRPSAAQRREFAKNMQDADFAQAYYKRKEEKERKRRETSRFDYTTAGGRYVPSKNQYVFCVENSEVFVTPEEQDARNFVISGYSCNEKVHHDFIHIVNEKIRSSGF